MVCSHFLELCSTDWARGTSVWGTCVRWGYQSAGLAPNFYLSGVRKKTMKSAPHAQKARITIISWVNFDTDGIAIAQSAKSAVSPQSMVTAKRRLIPARTRRCDRWSCPPWNAEIFRRRREITATEVSRIGNANKRILEEKDVNLVFSCWCTRIV